MKNTKPIVLGNKVKCLVTGFTGIASAKVEYLNGCIQFCVRQSVGKDGKMPEGEYIDVQQLKVVPGGITIPQKETGGPSDGPKRNGLARN